MIIIGLNASDTFPRRRNGNTMAIVTSGVITNVSSPKEIAINNCLLDRVFGISWFGEFDSCIIEKEELFSYCYLL